MVRVSGFDGSSQTEEILQWLDYNFRIMSTYCEGLSQKRASLKKGCPEEEQIGQNLIRRYLALGPGLISLPTFSLKKSTLLKDKIIFLGCFLSK